MAKIDCGVIPSDVREKLARWDLCQGSYGEVDTSDDDQENRVEEGCIDYVREVGFPGPFYSTDDEGKTVSNLSRNIDRDNIAQWRRIHGNLAPNQIDGLRFCAAHARWRWEAGEPAYATLWDLSRSRDDGEFEIGVAGLAEVAGANCIGIAKQACDESGLDDLITLWNAYRFGQNPGRRQIVAERLHDIAATVGRRNDSLPARRGFDFELHHLLDRALFVEDADGYPAKVRRMIDEEGVQLLFGEVYGPLIAEGDPIIYGSLGWWYQSRREGGLAAPIAQGVGRLLSRANIPELVHRFEVLENGLEEREDPEHPIPTQVRLDPNEPLMALYTVALYADDRVVADQAASQIATLCSIGQIGFYGPWTEGRQQFCNLPMETGPESRDELANFWKAQQALVIGR